MLCNGKASVVPLTLSLFIHLSWSPPSLSLHCLLIPSLPLFLLQAPMLLGGRRWCDFYHWQERQREGGWKEKERWKSEMEEKRGGDQNGRRMGIYFKPDLYLPDNQTQLYLSYTSCLHVSHSLLSLHLFFAAGSDQIGLNIPCPLCVWVCACVVI